MTTRRWGRLAYNAPVNSRSNLGLLDNGNNGLRAIPFDVRFVGFPGLGFRKAGTQGYRESGGTQWYRFTPCTQARLLKLSGNLRYPVDS